MANRLLKRVRDYAQVMGDGTLDAAISREALDRMQVDRRGLDKMDLRVLGAVIDRFEGGPVGIETLAMSLSEEADTIMDVYEPYLIQLGFIQTHPQGAHRHAPRLRIPRAALPGIGRPLEPADPFRGVAVTLWASAHLSARPLLVSARGDLCKGNYIAK